MNGGYTGLASRKAWLAKWKPVFADDAAEGPVDARDAPPDAAEAENMPPAVEIPRGSDEVLPPHVDGHPPQSLMADPTALAVGAGTVTTLASSLGGAVNSLKPFFADPHVLLSAAAVAIGVFGFIVWQRHQHIGSGNV